MMECLGYLSKGDLGHVIIIIWFTFRIVGKCGRGPVCGPVLEECDECGGGGNR